MPGILNQSQQYQGGQSLGVQEFIGAWGASPIVQTIAPWHRPGDLTNVVAGARLKSFVPVPIHSPGLKQFVGKWSFDENSGRVCEVTRGIWQKGSKINLFDAAELDISQWSKAPGTVAVEIGNNAPLCLVYILNGCYSGTPQDAAGNVIYLEGTSQIHPALQAYEQVYYDISEHKPLVVLDSDTGNHRLINPFRPDFMTDVKWWNAKENVAITAPNITAAIKNMQIRRAMNGIEMNLGDEGLEIWVPFSSKEDVRLLVEVMRQLPGTGTATPSDAIQVPISGGGNQVIFSVQDNPVFGRAKVRAISGMRSDLWCVVSPNTLRNPALSLFHYAHGGATGEYAITESPAPNGNGNVPHIWVYQWDQKSPMFAGTMPGTKAGDIGVSMMVNEGFAAGTGLLLEARFTNSAS
jgi:hypothetical protein